MVRTRPSRVGAGYKKVGELLDGCTYCDALADQWDHAPPQSCSHLYRGLCEFVMVPACGRCNVLLRNYAIPSVKERMAYVKLNTRKKGD